MTTEPWCPQPPAEDPPTYPARDPWRWYPDGKPTPEGWEDGDPFEDDAPTFERNPRSHSERGKVHGAAKRALPESRRRRP